jgi:tetratricopeptide (TPR) repeat protein
LQQLGTSLDGEKWALVCRLAINLQLYFGYLTSRCIERSQGFRSSPAGQLYLSAQEGFAVRSLLLRSRMACYHRHVLRDHSRHLASGSTLPAPERDGGGVYSRTHVCRLLHITGKQLRSWERQQLVPELVEYRFTDLLTLKTVIRLRADNVPPQRIRKTLESLRIRLRDIPNLLDEARIYKEGKMLRVQIGKHRMEPISGQLLFDFDETEINKLLQLPRTEKNSERIATQFRRKMEADHWFEKGLELEHQEAPIEQIIEAYQKAIEFDPQATGALVNLGTIFFNGHAWSDAEEQYQKALQVDPNYPLAHFNLGNLYDERGDLPNAVTHYLAALKLFPNYADVHYNLALLYQGQGDVMGALRHWKAYLKLDSASSWSQIARRELGKLEAATVVTGSRPPRVHPQFASQATSSVD